MAGSLIERHSVAAPQHLADGVHGRPYGGSSTLVVLTRWPGPFSADATLAGMSDTLFAGTERWLAPASGTEYDGRPTDVPVVELGERISGWFHRWL